MASWNDKPGPADGPFISRRDREPTGSRVAFVAAVAWLLLIVGILAVALDRSSVADAQAGQLTWRQNEVLVMRARTHFCQRELGVPRSPIAQKIVGGGPAYRAWVLKRWRYRAKVYCGRLERARAEPTVSDWAAVQMHYANLLAASSRNDPWPNCPDPGPRDNQGPGHTWYDTVACENRGRWLDSPGYYRCGLQFDPMWERHYGRKFCP